MKLIINIFLFVFSSAIYSQNLNDSDIKFNVQLNKFNLKVNESVINFNSLIDLQVSKQSIFSNKEIFNEKMLNVQFEKFNFKLPERKIDFNRFIFSCGVLEPINSKDMMISAFKYYILNKYVLSLFAKTDYN
jgi:hypothetical protein